MTKAHWIQRNEPYWEDECRDARILMLGEQKRRRECHWFALTLLILAALTCICEVMP